MDSTDNKEDSKLYYSIGEVSKRFGVNASLIRFWEKEFDVIRPKKNKKGNRLFTKEDIENFGLIFHLVKERGFTLEGAKKKLRENRHSEIDEFEIVNSLKKIRSFLVELRESV